MAELRQRLDPYDLTIAGQNRFMMSDPDEALKEAAGCALRHTCEEGVFDLVGLNMQKVCRTAFPR